MNVSEIKTTWSILSNPTTLDCHKLFERSPDRPTLTSEKFIVNQVHKLHKERQPKSRVIFQVEWSLALLIHYSFPEALVGSLAQI